MMSMLLLLMALSTMQNAVPLGGGDWITANDYPTSALRNSELGYVGFAVLVAPDGKPDRCEVVAPTPYSDLNDLSCKLVLRRARFRPARDSGGQPTYGVYRSQVSWLIASNPYSIERLRKRFPRPSDIDIVVSLNKAPSGDVLPLAVDLAMSVAAKGEIIACQPVGSDTNGKIGAIACEQATKLWKPLSAVTEAGLSVSSVQAVKVGFEIADGHPPRIDTPPPAP